VEIVVQLLVFLLDVQAIFHVVDMVHALVHLPIDVIAKKDGVQVIVPSVFALLDSPGLIIQQKTMLLIVVWMNVVE
jgi:selenocysteine lyase/cysteine desulfurase